MGAGLGNQVGGGRGTFFGTEDEVPAVEDDEASIGWEVAKVVRGEEGQVEMGRERVEFRFEGVAFGVGLGEGGLEFAEVSEARGEHDLLGGVTHERERRGRLR